MKKDRPPASYPREKPHRLLRTSSDTIKITFIEVWGRALQPERIRTGPPGTRCYLLL